MLLLEDDHYIYYYGQESLRRNGVAIIVNKRVRNAVLGCNLKNNRMITLPFPRQAIQYYNNPSLCPTSNAEEAEVEWFCEDLQDLLEQTHAKDVLFITGDWNAKVGRRDTWSNRQIWPWTTKLNRAKANRVLPRECTGHSKPSLPQHETTLHMNITRWSISITD